MEKENKINIVLVILLILAIICICILGYNYKKERMNSLKSSRMEYSRIEAAKNAGYTFEMTKSPEEFKKALEKNDFDKKDVLYKLVPINNEELIKNEE